MVVRPQTRGNAGETRRLSRWRQGSALSAADRRERGRRRAVLAMAMALVVSGLAFTAAQPAAAQPDVPEQTDDRATEGDDATNEAQTNSAPDEGEPDGAADTTEPQPLDEGESDGAEPADNQQPADEEEAEEPSADSQPAEGEGEEVEEPSEDSQPPEGEGEEAEEPIEDSQPAEAEGEEADVPAADNPQPADDVSVFAEVACTPDPGYDTCVAYTYSGADQAFTVPDGVTDVLVKAWGAGGGGSIQQENEVGAPGGSGAYVQGELAVTPGSDYAVMVGGGGGADGTPAPSTTCGPAYGFGGACVPARAPGPTYWDGGGGGGLSGLFSGSAPVTDTDQARAMLVAGGGGAGEGTTACDYMSAAGGAGGISLPGESTMQGVHGAFDQTLPGSNPTGGGGGYSGGSGTGRLRDDNCVFSANGGTSFIDASVANPIEEEGTEAATPPAYLANNPPRTAEPQYVAGVGVGETQIATPGGNGLVVIQWVEEEEPPPPLTCSADPFGYLFQTEGGVENAPTDAIAVNLVSGDWSVDGEDGEDVDIVLNGVAYNPVDDYMYAFTHETNNFGIARIGDGYAVQDLGPPTNWETFPGMNPRLGDPGVSTGEFTPDGHYWVAVVTGPEQAFAWAEIDLSDPSSPTYNEVVAAGTTDAVGPPGGTINNLGADWSYNHDDGHLYLVSRNTPLTANDFELTRFNTTTHQFETAADLGVLNNPVDGAPPTGFGATYADADGFMYASDNTTGGIWRIDMTTGDIVFFADGPASNGNDGARCYDAPVPIDLGDAPDSYGTTLVDNGPRHAIPGYDPDTGTAPLTLGATVDIETDGQPSDPADGDGADEDGVANPIVLVDGQDTTVTVSATNTTGEDAILAGWIDLDGNGMFDAGELQTIPVPAGTTAGDFNLTFDPANGASGGTYARFRLFPAGTDPADILPTGPASAGEVEDYPVEGPVQPPFECTGTPYLFQGFPTDAYEGDLVTGDFGDPVATDIEDGNINQLGYNVLDDYIYGWNSAEAPGGGEFPAGLVRVGSDYSVEHLGVPDGLTETMIGAIGDVDADGHYWLVLQEEGAAPGDSIWVEIDLVPGSATFGEVLDSGDLIQPTTPTGDPIAFNGDWSFNPADGLLYAIGDGPGGARHLLSFDRSTGTATDEGPLPGIPAASAVPNDHHGATYMDDDGFLYASNNETGEIYRVDVANVTASWFVDGPSSILNDGARCPLPVNIDLGDAPASYGTTLVDDGPRHAIPGYNPDNNDAPLMIGATIDPETDGFPGPDADGDDADATDDEDGVANPIVMVDGQDTTVTVSATNTTNEDATLAGWIDLDNSGTFDAGELQTIVVPAGSGTASYDLTFPATTSFGNTYARFRLFPAGTDPADILPTGPAAAGEVEDYPVTGPELPPFECTTTAYLFQGFPTDVYEGDLVTGDFGGAPVATDIAAGHINSLGYNPLDNYIYGWSNPPSGPGGPLPPGLVRIGSDYSVEHLGIPAGLTATMQSGIGDVDEDGHWWANLHEESAPAGESIWVEVDLAPGSPTFGQVVSSGDVVQPTTPTGGAITYNGDWAFNPADGLLYLLGTGPGGSRHLISFDRTTGTANYEGPLPAIPASGGTPPDMFGATYMDANGFLYASNNLTGEIYRVDLANVTATFFSQGPTATQNDGARCPLPVYVDYGDAPDSYGTELASNGARHGIPGYDEDTNTAPLMLGATIDPEIDGFPGPDADGDDTDNADDEDGVANPIVLTAGQDTTVTVSATNTTNEDATLAGWIDLDGNGTFDLGELRTIVVPANSGTADYDLTFDPATGFGDTYARFRLFSGDTDPADFLPTGPASAGEVEDYPVTGPELPPWECETNAPGLLFQYPNPLPPTSSSAIEMVTGQSSSLFPDFPDRRINAIGYNVVDDYLYGWDIEAGRIVRIGSDGNIQELSVPAGMSADDATAGFTAGDVDDNGHLWLHSAADVVGGTTNGVWYQVDLATMTVVANGTASVPPAADPLYPDWAFIAGTNMLWRVTGAAGNPSQAVLIGFDRTTHTWTTPVNLGNLATPNRFGAAYVDADGFLYVSNNDTGEIFRVDVDAGTATFFANGPASSGNDGARCPTPILIDFGDAPDSYGTTLASNGARHGIPNYDENNGTAPLMLGATIDPEIDGFPGPDADGDDTDATDDEDGVANPIVMVDGQDTTVTVSATNTSGEDAILAGWIDLDGNGTFDPGELQTIPVPAGTTAGDFNLTFDPANGAFGGTYARFRLFPAGTDPADILPTGPASAGEVEDYPVEGPIQPPFECGSNSSGILTQYPAGGTPTSVNLIDMVTGDFETPHSIDGRRINAIGYNVLDDYVYGWDQTASPPQMVRLGADGSVRELGRPVGHSGTASSHAGDVDDNGHYWYVSTSGGVSTWYQVDLVPGSPTFMEVLDSGPLPSDQIDWVYVPGGGDYLYTVRQNAAGTASDLYRFNRSTGVFALVGPLGSIADNQFGAMYADADGFMYLSSNLTGEIIRVDVQSVTATHFSDGPSSGGNDGARCPSPILIDFGDAPDSYGTTLASNGARHGIPNYDEQTGTAPLMLGATIDPEIDGFPGPDADGDDADATDDEDGVANPIVMTDGQDTTVTVSATNTTNEDATLAGWIDLDGNGTFDLGELRTIVVPAGTTAGDFNLTFDPATGFGDTYARFRLFPGGTDPAEFLPTGPASAGEVEDYPVTGPEQPPWECASNAPGLLFQGQGGSQVHFVDLVTGDFETLVTPDADVNATGYNVLDDYVYGWSQSRDEFVRVGSDGSVDGLGAFGITTDLVVGDVDDNGHLWAFAGSTWYDLDLATGTLDSGTAASPAGTFQGLDWAYIPGTDTLWRVASNQAFTESVLVGFNRTTHTWTAPVPLGNLGGPNSFNRVGAVFADADGFLYASYNNTGAIHRIDVNAGTATFLANGPSSSGNDGARCPSPIYVDLGDAPDSYGTELASNGPRHGIPNYNEQTGEAPLMLGASIDPEIDGVPTPGADGDDTADADDEDGVANPIVLTAGQDTTVSVSATNTSGEDAVLAGWIDLDGNGTFDAGELQTIPVPAGTTAGDFNLTFGPATATADTYARFRLFPGGTDPADIVPTGPASAGEVEDYPVTVAATEHDKELVDIVENDDGTYTVHYELTVTRTGGPGTYDLTDTLRYGDGVTIEGVTAANTQPGGIATEGNFDGQGNTLVADDIDIAAGDTHLYTVDVVISVDTETATFESSDCELGTNESGTGLFNESAVEIDNTTIEDDTCEIPPGEPDHDKEVTDGPTGVGNGRYEIEYTITVTNEMPGAGEYDLTDELKYGDGVTITDGPSITATPSSITPNPNWDGEGDIVVVTDQPIDGAVDETTPTVHTYVVTVEVEVAADIPPEDADCDLQTGGGDGTGFLNTATMNVNGEVSDEDACVLPPDTDFDKELVDTISNGDGTYTLVYELIVTRTGDGPGYDLDDTLTYGDAVTVDNVAVTDAPAAATLEPNFDGEANVRVASGVPIGDGDTHLYEITIDVTVDGESVTFENSDCEGDEGTGFSNEAAVTTNGQTITDDTCEEFPATLVDKETTSEPTALPNGNYEIEYTITATNSGAAPDEYDLTDQLLYGDGITVVDAQVTNTQPGGIATNPNWNGDGDIMVVEDEPIDAATDQGPAVHVYTVTVEVEIPPDLDPETADCELQPGEGGTGLLNEATVNGQSGEYSDRNCPPTPETDFDKNLVSKVSNEDGTYTLSYELIVTRRGIDGTYDLRDELLLSDAVSVVGQPTVANTQPGGLPVNGGYDGVGDTLVAGGVDIAAGDTHLYTVDVVVEVDLEAVTPENSDCDLTPGEPGTGAMNQASLEIDNQTLEDDDCDVFPGTTIDKEVASGPTPLGNGEYEVVYELTVMNSGAGDDIYDLTDELKFGGGITIVDAEVTNTQPGGITTSSTWDGVNDIVVVTDEPIAGADPDPDPVIHTYEVRVVVEAPPDLDPTEADCTPGEGGTGLFNEATVTGESGESTDEGCVEPPTTDFDKNVVDGPVGNNDGTYTITYELLVSRIGDGPAYDLDDELRYGDAVTVEDVSATNTDPGGIATNPNYDGESDTIVAGGVDIADGEMHRYEVVVVFSIDTEEVTFENSDCTEQTDETGTGLLNTASVTVNDTTIDDEECPPPPGEPIVGKTITSVPPTPMGNGRYEITYEITATNPGAGDGVYTVNDELLYGDGITVISAQVANTQPGGITTNPNWDGEGTIRVVTDEPIAGGTAAAPEVHTYEVTVVAEVDPGIDPVEADCDPTTGEPGTGFLNRATLTVNGKTLEAEDCEEAPFDEFDKELVDVTANGDGNYTLTYELTVTRTHDGPGYDLDDTLRYGDAVTVDSVTATNTQPGGIATNPSFDGESDVRVASGVPIAHGVTHVYQVVVDATVAGDQVTFENSDCELDGEGTGFFNEAAVTSNGSTVTDEDCEPPAGVTVGKTTTEGPTPLGGGEFEIVYEITATNTGAGDGTYNVDDELLYGDGITVVSAQVANTQPGGIATNPNWDGESDIEVVAGEPIAGAADAATPTVHIYEVTVVAEVDPGIDPADADCDSSTGGGSGTGFLNRATMTGDSSNDDAEACPIPSVNRFDKDLVEKISRGDRQYELVYELSVERLQGGDTTYTVRDDLMLNESLTVDDVTAINTQPGGIATNPNFDGDSDIVVADGVAIGDGDVHLYEVRVTVTVNTDEVTPENSDCNLTGGESGTGAMNEATLEVDGLTYEAEECEEFPSVTHFKDVTAGPTPVGDGNWEITYEITVVNSGAGEDEYDLDDELRYGDGITVNSVQIANTQPGGITPNPDWDGQDDVMVVEGEPIAGDTTHVYEVVVEAHAPAGLDPEAADCEGESGTGFSNRATLTVGEDVDVVETCEEVPRTGVDKELVSKTPNGDGTYTLDYEIIVSQTGGDGTYRLIDELGYGNAVTVNSVTAANVTPGGITTNPGFDGVDDTLIADGVAIAEDDTHLYEVSVVATVDISSVTFENSDCETGNGGSGFYNEAAVTSNGTTERDDDCDPVAGVSHAKEVTAGPDPLGDGRYEVEYTVTVVNHGAGDDTYLLDDQLTFGDGVSIESAEVTNATPGGISTNPNWNGQDRPRVVTDQPIDGASAGDPTIHTYTVAVVVDVAGGVAPAAADCELGEGEDGTGLLNTATMTVNGEPTEDDTCTDVPGEGELDINKVADATEVSPGGEVAYTIDVTNIGTVDYTAEDPAEITDDLSDVLDDATWLDDAEASSGELSFSSPELVWSGPLAVGDTVTITYTVQLNDTVTGNGELFNTVSSEGESNCPPDSDDPACSTTTPVVPPTDPTDPTDPSTPTQPPAPPASPSPVTPSPVPVTG